jgi:protein SCO1/2
MRTVRRALPALYCVAILLSACGPRDETVQHSVRGEVVRVADGGRSLVIDHEDIPGYMDAMRMTMPVQDAAQSQGLVAGDPIRFELFVSGSSALIGSIEKLPAGTALDLATGGGDAP